jgi:hypothetical protein
MRFTTTRLALAAATGAAALAVALPGAAFASGATAGVDPSTARPGTSVDFGIDCGTKAHGASLTGTSIGLPSNIAMHKSGRELFGLTVTVPHGVKPGTYHVSMQCSNGHSAVAKLTVAKAAPVAWAKVSTEVAHPGDTVHFGLHCGGPAAGASLTGTSLGLPSNIAMNKHSKQRFGVKVQIPNDIRIGKVYHVSMQCSNGASTVADLAVMK